MALETNSQTILSLLIAFLLGFFATALHSALSNLFRIGVPNGQPYGLDQARLNIDIPPRSMWMNMGYWTLQKNGRNPSESKRRVSFPEACRMLLEQVLTFANFTLQAPLEDGVCRITPPLPEHALHIIDVGFGCGDQSLYLLEALRGTSASSTRQDSELVDSYTGISIDKTQHAFAQHRLKYELAEGRFKGRNAKLFRADAATPAMWPEELKLRNSATTESAQTWILALDTLYHFDPSRTSLLKHAAQRLHANVMAFDIFLSPTATITQRLTLRIICPLLGVPFRNLMTQDKYYDMLADAGFPLDGVRIADISQHVFPGLSKFLEERDFALQQSSFGGLGKLRPAKWLFSWWAKSGAVQGCLVVAHAGSSRTKME